MPNNNYDEDVIQYALESASRINKKRYRNQLWCLRDEEYTKRIAKLYLSFRKMFDNTGVSVCVKDIVTDRYDVGVVVSGKEVVFDDIKELMYLSSVADGIETDLDRDGNVRVSFYVFDVADVIAEV